jgi:hypothetical protein
MDKISYQTMLAQQASISARGPSRNSDDQTSKELQILHR